MNLDMLVHKIYDEIIKETSWIIDDSSVNVREEVEYTKLKTDIITMLFETQFSVEEYMRNNDGQSFFGEFDGVHDYERVIPSLSWSTYRDLNDFRKEYVLETDNVKLFIIDDIIDSFLKLIPSRIDQMKTGTFRTNGVLI